MADEEDMEFYLQVDQKPAPSLTTSPTSSVATSPTSSLANPLSLPPNRPLPYVTHLVSVGAAPGAGAVVVAGFSSPENTLAAFHLGRGTLEKVGSWIGHEGGITCVLGSNESRFFGASVFGSCGKDGVVRLWDVRSGSVGSVYQGTERNSEDASIMFWDQRKPSVPIRIHSSTHSEDIQVLAFHPDKPSVVLSGSADGLLSISNALEDEEDEAVVHVGNWGCSVSRAGWSLAGEEIWSHSDMETLATWDGELDQMHDLGDIRRVTSTQWHTDYLVDVCPYDNRNNGPGGAYDLLAGTNGGDIALINAGSAEWTVEGQWMGGHEGVVRCMIYEWDHQCLLSGGEDGKINVWPSHGHSHQGARP